MSLGSDSSISHKFLRAVRLIWDQIKCLKLGSFTGLEVFVAMFLIQFVIEIPVDKYLIDLERVKV